MTTPDPTQELAKRLFQRASDRIDPATRQRLHAIRHSTLNHAAEPRHASYWLPAGAFAALALAVTLSFWTVGHVPEKNPLANITSPTMPEENDVFDEDPEVYAWLADAPIATTPTQTEHL